MLLHFENIKIILSIDVFILLLEVFFFSLPNSEWFHNFPFVCYSYFPILKKTLQPINVTPVYDT